MRRPIKLDQQLGPLPRLAALLLALLATLSVSAAENQPSSKVSSEVARISPLPMAVASFGAAVAEDHLYVYGGHVGRTHHHSIENLNHNFQRLSLVDPKASWEDLGEVLGLQGLALVPSGDQVCRVGGLSAHNQTTEDSEDLYSVDTVACYDPQARSWQELPPLPRPRSSHDAFILDGKIYVAGGWQLRGKDEEPLWAETLDVLDLASSEPAWESVPQPFRRRALAVAVADDRFFVLGGLTEEGTSRRVDVYDPATGEWTEGPHVPCSAQGLQAFGASAYGVGDEVYVSTADGIVHALDTATDRWRRDLGKLEAPRFFHRLVAHDGELFFVGGSASGGHIAEIEKISPSTLVPGAVLTDRGSWPSFRGRGSSVAPEPEVPVKWSENDNVAWREPLPGYGQSAPVVWGGQVFLTSVVGEKKETLVLSALDLETGEVRWRRRFPASLEIESKGTVSRGAPTPAVDRERVYAFWESGDLIAVDHDGETLWHRSLSDEFGPPEGNHGLGSSLALTADAAIVQVTHEGPSYLMAVKKEDGETLWKADRPSKVAWTTPVVVRGARGAEVISSAAGRVEAFDAVTGELLWNLNGIERNNVPSVTVDEDLVVVASSDAGHNFALRRDALGSPDTEAVAWRGEGVTSGFGSPVIHDGCVLFANKSGTVTCLDRATGEQRWRHRLEDAAWASPIAAGDRVFYFTKGGVTTVLRHGEEGPEVVAQNALPTEEPVYGVAAVRGAFLIRTGTEIIRVGVDPQPQASEEAQMARK